MTYEHNERRLMGSTCAITFCVASETSEARPKAGGCPQPVITTDQSIGLSGDEPLVSLLESSLPTYIPGAGGRTLR